MKIFEVGWHCYEEALCLLFLHPNKTDKEFKKDVLSVIRKYGEEYLKQEDSWASAERWIEYAAEKLNELGYTQPEITSVGFSGSSIISSERDNHYGNHWQEVVGIDLFQKALAHNKKINDGLFNDE